MVRPMRQNPARPFARLAALLLVALLVQPALVQPTFAQDDDLPEGVEAYASTQAACFAPGELAGLDAGIDAARQPLRGCASGVIPPEPKIVAAHAYKPGGGDKFDCASLRRRQESSRFLYAFLGDVVAAAERGDNACAAGMLRTWAEAGAMTSAAANSPGPSRALGMFVFGGLSSAYLIHPEVRAARRKLRSLGRFPPAASKLRLPGCFKPKIAPIPSPKAEFGSGVIIWFEPNTTSPATGPSHGRLQGFSRDAFTRGRSCAAWTPPSP